MSGYRFNFVESNNPVVENEGNSVIDGGNSLTNYLVVFNNGSATGNPNNPVVLNFGGAT
jgi:hypothetical protein